MDADPALGWDAIADAVVRDRARTRVGGAVLARWAHALPPRPRVLDLGCGGGDPVSRILVEAGAMVAGVDASPRMIACYRTRHPEAEVECAPAEAASLLDRRWDAVVAVGLLFLLDEPSQRLVLQRAAHAIVPGGRLLFTAPWQIATWTDRSTGRESRSLGRDAYVALLDEGGLEVVETIIDDGDNHYFSAVKRG